jgi:hypothetical protein
LLLSICKQEWVVEHHDARETMTWRGGRGRGREGEVRKCVLLEFPGPDDDEAASEHGSPDNGADNSLVERRAEGVVDLEREAGRRGGSHAIMLHSACSYRNHNMSKIDKVFSSIFHCAHESAQ